jgi:methylglutamate dehydrogenase subunit D
VPEIILTRTSPLSVGSFQFRADVPQKPDSIVVSEIGDYALCSVIQRSKGLPQVFKEKFGIELPNKPRHIFGRKGGVVSIGPSQWLVLCSKMSGLDFEQELISSLGETASVFDQTDGRALFSLSGIRARQALSKGVLIDLHDSTFRPGSAASTSIANMSVTLWQVDDKPTYEFAVFRSFAESFWEWLVEASAEFGVEIHLFFSGAP